MKILVTGGAGYIGSHTVHLLIQYSPTQFFRNVPNTLLARYFQEKGNALQEIAFDQLKETEVDPIFQAFTALPPEKQAEIEAEFQEIDTMSCQGGVLALN